MILLQCLKINLLIEQRPQQKVHLLQCLNLYLLNELLIPTVNSRFNLVFLIGLFIIFQLLFKLGNLHLEILNLLFQS